MKRIVITQENSKPIVLYDEENTDFPTYALELSEIMKSKEITLLETSSGIAIIKPSKISGIHISEVKERPVESIDMITDGD